MTRFWSKVNKHGPRAGRLGFCWVWTAAMDNNGYGHFSAEGKIVRAHVWLWEQEHGPVPEGMELDHLCRVRACVRPSHLEPVTKRINILRGNGLGAKYARRTHCPAGHPYSGDNLYIRPGTNARVCRTCRSAYDHRRYQHSKEAA